VTSLRVRFVVACCALLSACAAIVGNNKPAPVAAAAPSAAVPTSPRAAPKDLAQLPPYQRVPSAQGVLTLSGSSAVATFARAWGSAYARVYPAASVNVIAKSSGAAIADMLSSPGTIGMTSRPLTAAEREGYAKQHGRPR
jgi:ABC-type phosphate transport system substrate-binding protein